MITLLFTAHTVLRIFAVGSWLLTPATTGDKELAHIRSEADLPAGWWNRRGCIRAHLSSRHLSSLCEPEGHKRRGLISFEEETWRVEDEVEKLTNSTC